MGAKGVYAKVRPILPLLGVIAGLLVLFFVPWLVTGFYLSVANEILIYGLLALSIDILMGYTGLPPLGHAAFFGIGAYACAYMTATQHIAFVPSFLTGLVLAAVASVIFGAISIRTTGLYFLMITLALNMLVYGTAFTLYSVTRAENGITGVNRPAFLQADWIYYYFCAVVFVVMMVFIWRLVSSPFGLTLMGIRESESRMRTLGYNVWLHKLIAFTLSGTIAGVAGCLYAFWQEYVSVSQVDLPVSIAGLLEVIIGGAGYLFGPVLGAWIVVSANEILSLYTERWQTILGLILIAVVLFARNGILGAVDQWRRRRGSRGASPAAEDALSVAVSEPTTEPDVLQA
jgi:branched-chain amino acid transport system permease protein